VVCQCEQGKGKPEQRQLRHRHCRIGYTISEND
jgi:hypothetical protein